MSPHTVVFFNTHHRGHLAPTLSLAANFVRAGHKVVYFAPRSAHQLLASTGAELRCYKADEQWNMQQRAVDIVENKLQLPADVALKEELLFVQVLPIAVDILDFCINELKGLSANLVIYDAACAWAKLAASVLNIPAVSSCSSTLMGLEERKAVCGFIGERDDAKACLKWLVENHGLEYDPCDVYCNYDEYTIVWSLPELQPHSKGFPFAHFFGASLDPTVSDADFPMHALVNAKLTGKRIVYFSMGTVVGQEGWNVDIMPLFHDFLKHFAENEKYFVVMSVGARKQVADVLSPLGGKTPSNFILAQSVPQVLILQNADVFITHGGNGFNEALFCATPMMVIPIFGDQHMNAATVKRLKLGTTIDSPFAPAPAENLEYVTSQLIEQRLDELCGDFAAIKASIGEVQAKLLEKQKFLHQDAVAALIRYADGLKVSMESGVFARSEEPRDIALSGSGSFRFKKLQRRAQ